MDEQLISLLRRPTGLAALVSRRRQAFTRPRPVPVGEIEALAEIDPYVEEVRGLGKDSFPWWGDLRRSWESLGRVRTLDADTLYHTLHVLLYSLPEGEASGVAPLKIEPATAAMRPSAAHPRAYRGTKVQLPKLKQTAVVDLRPHLCSARDVNRLLAHLAPFLPDATRRLAQGGNSTDNLWSLIGDNGLTLDPYLQECHATGDRSVHDLPVFFRTHLLFWLRGSPWTTVSEALSLYWGLASDTVLLQSFARFLAAYPVPRALRWGQVLFQQPPERRRAFAELMVEAGVQSQEVSDRLIEMISEVDRLSPDSVYRHRMYTFLVNLSGKGRREYLLDGIRLAQQYDVTHGFAEVDVVDEWSISAIHEFITHVTQSTDDGVACRPRYALWLWKACGELKGFARFLNERHWIGLGPDAAYQAIQLIDPLFYSELDQYDRQTKWQALQEKAPRCFAMLRGIPPDFQEKAIRYLRDLICYWNDPEALARNLERYCHLLPRLCREPFARHRPEVAIS